MVGGFRSEALFKSGLPSAVRLAAWQAFEREGKGRFGKASFRRERNARGGPSRFAFRVSPFPFPFKRLPRRPRFALLLCCLIEGIHAYSEISIPLSL